jgi:two-component system phosphate regulon sensor histidine kinase PhoR
VFPRALDGVRVPPYHLDGPVFGAPQAIVFDAIPLLALAAACAAALATLAALVMLRGRRSTQAESPPAEADRLTQRNRELAAATISTRLARADGPRAVADALLDEVAAFLEVEVGSLVVVDDDRRFATLLAIRKNGREIAELAGTKINLENEPSGVASAVFDAAPFAVYDAASSPRVSRRLVEAVGVQSIAYVPLIASQQVIAVLVAGSVAARRTFHGEELGLMQTLAAEAALALERIRSAAALTEAVERERLIARISRQVRSELDVDAVLEVAVAETGRALGVQRCFVRLGVGGDGLPLAAEWAAEGFEPIGDRASRLAVSNLVAQEGRTIAVDDVRTDRQIGDPELGGRETLLELGTLAVLATPIVVFGETIGVFGLHRATAGAWPAAEAALADAVAREVGLALHTARLLGENAQRLEQQAGLLRAAQALTGELELESVLERLVEQVAQLLDADAVDCYLLVPERGALRCAAVYGLDDALVGFEFPRDRGLAGQALREERPVLTAGYERLPDPVPHPAYEGFTAGLVAPMIWSGTVRGVLGVGSRAAERTFTQGDADLLEAFAGLASLALRNAESFAERSRQARVQRGFYRIASVLSQSLSLAATLDAVATAAGEALGGVFAAVLRPRGDTLALTGARVVPPAVAAFAAEGLPRSAGPLVAAGRAGRVLAAPSVAEDERFGEDFREALARAGFQALLAVPVETVRGETGGLVVVFFAEPRPFTDDDLELATHLAGATRAALERSQLFEAERTSRALAQQLARTGSLLATELDPVSVLDEVVQRAPALLGVEACTIRLLEGEELVVSAASGEGAASTLGAREPSSGWLSAEVVQCRAPVAVSDLREGMPAVDPLAGLGYRSFLGVPLVGPEGALHGVLAVYGSHVREWREEEIEALSALAANTSAALSNAELYQRVADEKERSTAIIENIADGIVAVDREGHVVLWNRAAEQVTGVPQEEALGRTPTQVLRRRLEGDGDAPGGNRLVSITRGADEVWLSLTEAVMRDPAGLVAGRIFAFRDISADRYVEEMKSDFVSAVSHELRSPLTSIYGFAETLLRQDVLFGEEERRTFLGYIASESERLTTIVDALLNVARLDSGDLQVTINPVNVNSVVSEAVSSLEEGGTDVNGHRFVVDLPPEPVTAEADRDKLRQILGVLLDNAIKYSPEGGTVTVAARCGDERVEIEVADEGIGIPAHEQERIFRKFYRAEGGAGARGAGGTGLGLFIARGLVSAMGGRIWVTSAEGQGARFAFELPLASAPVPSVRE